MLKYNLSSHFSTSNFNVFQSDNVMIYDAVWAMAKAIDELGTMKQINVEPVSCKDGAQKRQNSLGKKSADEILKKLLDVSY